MHREFHLTCALFPSHHIILDVIIVEEASFKPLDNGRIIDNNVRHKSKNCTNCTNSQVAICGLPCSAVDAFVSLMEAV